MMYDVMQSYNLNEANTTPDIREALVHLRPFIVVDADGGK